MASASLNEIRKELQHVDAHLVQAICLRLARYKKENKELLSYLLFEAHNEQDYIQQVKAELDALFEELTDRNVYLIKKILRKILRYTNRQIKYSGLPQTELELRIYFCEKIVAAQIPLSTGTVLYNLYQQQLKKIGSVLDKLPEDLQGDYTTSLKTIRYA
jgi:membrane-anchored protein YejM (alkaline phosphatase superfamily)